MWKILIYSVIAIITGSLHIASGQHRKSCTGDNICLNNGICEERPLAERGHICKCTEEYQGFRCENKLPEVKCLSDRIVLIVGKSLVMDEIGINQSEAGFVYLGHGGYSQNQCTSYDEGDHFKIILFPPFKGCGTNSYMEESTVVYKNRVFLDTTHSSSVANRYRMVLLDWSCVYASNYKVSYPFGIQPDVNRPEQKTIYGKFTMDLKVFRKRDFAEESLLRPPALLSVGQPVFVQIELLTSAYNGLAVAIISCVASTDAEPTLEESTSSRYLVENGCPSWQDATVKIHQSGISRKARFSFQMFMWSAKPAPVYLHCLVSVCNTTQHREGCQSNCSDESMSSRERKRRELKSVEESSYLRLTIGPFLIDTKLPFVPSKPTQIPSNSFTAVSILQRHRINKVYSKPQHIVVGVLVGVGAVALVVISVAVLRHNSQLLGIPH